jgi:hypothetical protein
MTVVANEHGMVPIPSAKPGEEFDLEITERGSFILVPVRAEAIHAEGTIEKVNGFTVGKVNHPVDQRIVAELSRNFP